MPRPLISNRRDRILDAAETLVLERGFDAMTVAAVAADAGIAKGAVYLEFSGKKEILDALLTRGHARMKALVLAEVGETPGVSEAYRASVRVLLDDALMTAAFLDDRGVLGTHVGTAQDDRYRRQHLGVIEWLADLQRSGRVSDDVDPAGLALVLSSTSIGLLSAAKIIGPLSRAQLEEAIETIGRMAATFEVN